MKHKEFTEFFLKIKAQSLAELTLLSYQRCLARYLPADEELTDMDIFKAQTLMFEMDNLSQATKRRNLIILTQYYDYAIKYKKTQENPFRGVERPRTIKNNPVNYAYSEIDLERLLSALNELPIMWRALFVLALDSGARRGELIALTWTCFDFKNNSVTISHSAYSAHSATHIKEPKGKKEKTIKITNETKKLLLVLQKEQKKAVLKRGASWTADGYVFTGRNGKMLSPSSVSHKFKSVLINNSLTNHRLHDLRHTCATLLLAHGVDVNTVRLRLGHASLNTTMLYSHSDEQCFAADVMDSLLTRNTRSL